MPSGTQVKASRRTIRRPMSVACEPASELPASCLTFAAGLSESPCRGQPRTRPFKVPAQPCWGFFAVSSRVTVFMCGRFMLRIRANMIAHAVVACLAFTGCRAKPAAITTHGELLDDAGENRLQLRCLEWPPNAEGETEYDFHSLVWEARYGEIWAEQFVITAAISNRARPKGGG